MRIQSSDVIALIDLNLFCFFLNIIYNSIMFFVQSKIKIFLFELSHLKGLTPLVVCFFCRFLYQQELNVILHSLSVRYER